MKTTTMAALIAAATMVQGCAHKAAEKTLDEKVAQESEIKSRGDLTKEATQMIETSTTLTESQKKQLFDLRDFTRAQNDALIAESLKLRSVLIKDLISNYNEKEVALIKKKIKSIENKRVSVLFESIDKANKILGRQAVRYESVMREFSDFHAIR